MGMQTDYNLKLSKSHSKFNEDELGILTDYEGWWEYNGNNSYRMTGKWYDHDVHMIEISKKYPSIVFTLSCLGEEGDKWVIYYKKGKSQRADIVETIEEYDPRKLK